MTSPCCGFSAAVSGMMMPPAVLVSPSTRAECDAIVEDEISWLLQCQSARLRGCLRRILGKRFWHSLFESAKASCAPFPQSVNLNTARPEVRGVSYTSVPGSAPRGREASVEEDSTRIIVDRSGS